MNENHDASRSVYEIGYLIIPSVPEEKIPAEAEAIHKLVADAGSEVIAEEAPRSEHLAYVMRKKNASGSYEKYEKAYFGWLKFELDPDKIEALKKAVETHPSVLRSLLITTTRENTYMGKRATAIAAEFGAKRVPAESPGPAISAKKEETKIAAPASIEEMDKSIEEMVKEA